jgi:hypothetical protein
MADIFAKNAKRHVRIFELALKNHFTLPIFEWLFAAYTIYNNCTCSVKGVT